MDIAARQNHPRARAQSYIDRDGTPNDSGGETESYARRKFPRTAGQPESSPGTFLKPTLPASATRAAKADQQRSAFGDRRKSTLRDNVRIPSGPREYPGSSPGKRVSSFTSPPATATPESTTRSFLPQIPSEPLFGNNNEPSRLSLRQREIFSTRATGSPSTSTDHLGDSFDFPTLSFDDLQTSIAAYDGTKPLLREAPTMPSRHSMLKENENRSMGDTYTSSRNVTPRIDGKETGIGRTPSFRRQQQQQNQLQQQQPGGGLTLRSVSGQMATQVPTSASQQNLALRTRRQSSLTQGVTSPPSQSPVPGGRQPRKSVGPGLLTNMMENRKVSQPTPTTTTDPRPPIPRTGSLHTARRSVLQPPGSGGLDAPRMNAVNATTQSRANKVKTMQPLSREQEPNTPNSSRYGRGSQSRDNTPSSSGQKRQSTLSGRASGLGARTISPTDARRLKRMSMMHAPPLPTSLPKGPSTPLEDPMSSYPRPDMPRLTQPSPSLIPRKTSSLTPTSARASPEVRSNPGSIGGVSLSTKSSYQSLLSNTGSTSRLPTPRPRNVHSSSTNYGEEEEMVPPVPAIPKAYESPKENEVPFFSSVSSKSSGSLAERASNTDLNASAPATTTPRSHGGSLDNPQLYHQRAPSSDSRRQHKRTQTAERALTPGSAVKQNRPQPDPTGRKNNSLQPLRLPPLNLMPISAVNANKANALPRPSQEVDGRDDSLTVQTPEPKRTAKTPSTPMTASRATFFRRQDEDMSKQKGMRASTSHNAFRDIMQLDDNTARFFDDSDNDLLGGGSGVAIPNSKHRSAITPFSSGSLPKVAAEFPKSRGRPSLEYRDEYDLGGYNDDLLQAAARSAMPRPKTTGGPVAQAPKPTGTPSSQESPIMEMSPHPSASKDKKDGSTGGGLRRKLSLSWKRSNSKAENLLSPSDDSNTSKDTYIVAKRASEMPPPRLPASAHASVSGGTGQTLPGPRSSMESTSRMPLAQQRRKSTFGSVQHSANNSVSDTLGPNGSTNGAATTDISSIGGIKTKSLHSEKPQAAPTGSRSTSWGNFTTNTNSALRPPTAGGKPMANGGLMNRKRFTAPAISAIIKDKDDLGADDEMRRLSTKRRDVDSAARESEQLKARAIARSPVTAERVLHDRNCQLNIFERGEIVDYDKDGIYFTGTKNAKKIIGAVGSTTSADKNGNFGYDDERGDYNIVLGDHLSYRYEVVDVLGKGSFGQVVRCVDHKEGGVVAVKIIRNKKRFHQQALVEVGILGKLGDWDPDGSYATLSLTSSFYFRSHLCIVTPCLSINLYELIRAHNFVGFPLPLIRRFGRQLLACLVLLQQKRIIHCDLKPENILLCEARKADVRVIDFGSSCREEEKVYTYIQSRFYRSPEVILGSSYGLGIDMWSLGCILAEMFTGYPLFPGENEQEQLACIMEIFGPPDRHLVEKCTRKKLFFDSVGKPRVTVSSKGRRRRPSSKTLSQALKTDDEAFLDFVTRCLRWDPERRLKPAEAIAHPFITNMPMNQRPGIPDEARRAARARSTVGMPTSTTGAIPSPTKRGTALATASGNGTPVRGNRTLPDAPQSSLRSHPPVSIHNESPARIAMNRRHSTVATAGSVAANANKRVSNGAALSGISSPATSSATSQATLNLAQMAAKESMGGAGQNSAPVRWKGP